MASKVVRLCVRLVYSRNELEDTTKSEIFHAKQAPFFTAPAAGNRVQYVSEGPLRSRSFTT